MGSISGLDLEKYLDILRQSIDNEKKIDKALGNLECLYVYLSQWLNIDLAILYKPALFEIIKEYIKLRLLDSDCIIDKKFILSQNKEKLYVDSAGKLHLSSTAVIKKNDGYQCHTPRGKIYKDNPDGYLFYEKRQESMFIPEGKYYINSYGTIDYYTSGLDVEDVYSQLRVIDNGKRMIYTYHKNENIKEYYRMDLGNPMLLLWPKGTFYNNLKYYYEEYPILKDWYINRFEKQSINLANTDILTDIFLSNQFLDKDVKAYSVEVQIANLDLRIAEIADEIDVNKNTLREYSAKIKKNRFLLDKSLSIINAAKKISKNRKLDGIEKYKDIKKTFDEHINSQEILNNDSLFEAANDLRQKYNKYSKEDLVEVKTVEDEISDFFNEHGRKDIGIITNHVSANRIILLKKQNKYDNLRKELFYIKDIKWNLYRLAELYEEKVNNLNNLLNKMNLETN